MILFPTDDPPGPSTTLYVGRVVIDIDADQVFTVRQEAGRAIDVCAALGASATTPAHAGNSWRDAGVMLDHVGIQCADLSRSSAFYDAVLAPLGASRLMDFEVAIGYGVPPHPDFWIGVFDSGEGFRESHLAFTAASRDVVREFFDAAVSNGAEVLHEPRVWPEYHEHYFGAFVRDPDGNNVEAVCHVPGGETG